MGLGDWKKDSLSLINKKNVCKIFLALVVVAAAVAVYAYRDSLPEFPFLSRTPKLDLPETPENCIKGVADSYTCTVKVDKTSADCVSHCQDDVHKVENEFSGKHYPKIISDEGKKYFNMVSKLSFKRRSDIEGGFNTVCSDTCDGSASNIVNGNHITGRRIELANSQGVIGEIFFNSYIQIEVE